MTTSNLVPLYDSLVDVLASSADRNTILNFRLDRSSQERLDRLLEKSRQGTIDADESSELATFEQFEHVVRLLKARVLQGHRS